MRGEALCSNLFGSLVPGAILNLQGASSSAPASLRGVIDERGRAALLGHAVEDGGLFSVSDGSETSRSITRHPYSARRAQPLAGRHRDGRVCIGLARAGAVHQWEFHYGKLEREEIQARAMADAFEAASGCDGGGVTAHAVRPPPDSRRQLGKQDAAVGWRSDQASRR
jgi:hypothetical protein